MAQNSTENEAFAKFRLWPVLTDWFTPLKCKALPEATSELVVVKLP